MIDNKKIAVVIPVYNVGETIAEVIKKIPSYIDYIFVVDDSCPLKTGKIVETQFTDKKVKVYYNKINLGVGGSTKVGYLECKKLEIDIILKIDGDDQMDCKDIINFINVLKDNPSISYVKGNRFLSESYVENYPLARFYGNIGLSFLTKLSSGYWNLFDPINGFTAITLDALKKIKLENIDNRYFFETDLLFNLNLLNLKVKDVPVSIKYHKNQIQNLSVFREMPIFFFKNIYRFLKRVNKKYFTNNFTVISLFAGLFFLSTFIMLFYSIPKFIYYALVINTFAPTGVIMFSGISLIVCIFSFLIFCVLDSQENPNSK